MGLHTKRVNKFNKLSTKDQIEYSFHQGEYSIFMLGAIGALLQAIIIGGLLGAFNTTLALCWMLLMFFLGMYCIINALNATYQMIKLHSKRKK